MIETELIRYINLKLAALGQPTSNATADPEFLEIAGPLLKNYHQKDQLLGGRLCPTDARIQAFLDSYLRSDRPQGAARLPANTFVLDRAGLGRVMSLPPTQDTIQSPYLRSYRIAQGILHNPKSDRRTTKGIFHIAEGGLPVPADKYEVPRRTYAALLDAALQPPPAMMALPFTADQEEQARLWVSLLMRPLVCPATDQDPHRSMEIRFFVPASLVSNLDFVEGIFGNGGDPYLPENDAALDAAHWTGHTGCVILAPHILGLTKKELGLPHVDQATERQRRDGMCWKQEDEVYNDGGAFKITARDQRGVMVTIIADNYFGYCKKEVKTQISFSANLFGGCEEEHAGGALAFPSYVLGQEFYAGRTVLLKRTTFDRAMEILGTRVQLQPEGYAIDCKYQNIFYLPETAEFHVREGKVRWEHNGTQSLTLRVGSVYILPSGYKIRLEKQLTGSAWRLVGTRADGTLCHKPCTVSGGGKSEISKSIANALLKGPVFVRNYAEDIKEVAAVLKKDYSDIFITPPANSRAGRPILSTDRSLGSVIKLLTPSADYKPEYNEWLRALSQTTRQLVFTVKRYYHPDWEANWKERFTVDRINGFLGHELKYNNEKLVSNYLRVGFDPNGSWRIYKLRPDFHPATKVQLEDDITASVVLPAGGVRNLDARYSNPSVKLVENCESLLFQRPDEAIHRGFDRQAEADIATPGTFLSNYEPLTRDQVRAMVDHVVEFDEYTDAMRRLLEGFAANGAPAYAVSSAHPRLVDGKPSKNPRYLQRRPDLVDPREGHIGEAGIRLEREIPFDEPVYFPVNAVLAGRRGNPADPSINLPPLAVYNPIHYQELPELFMDFVCSLTGKSPSTTGFGSEGALTKGPFNALWPVVDLNNALVSYILTGYAGFTSSAGHIGPNFRMDHDVSMLIPEIWCRMRIAERDPKFLIENGLLEPVKDFEFEGRRVEASRLGYRITALFAERFMGRIFETPDTVFPEEILRPEKQDLAQFAAGVHAIVEGQRRVALNYFEDGSVHGACPPLKALLHIMAYGDWEGKRVTHLDVRAMFTREALLASSWYKERLRVKQQRDIQLWQRHVAALQAAAWSERLVAARKQLARVSSPTYFDELVGSLGADPFTAQLK